MSATPDIIDLANAAEQAIRTSSRAIVVDWSRELEGARILMRSGLLPASVKTPEAALFIILAGRDLGLSPVQSLRSIHVIQGKIEVAADLQLGLFHRAGGKSRWLEGTPTNERAIIEFHAPWLVEPHTETFTIEDAKRAKLAGDNWVKYPKAMLRSRAITAGLKSVGFDPTAGVYAEGEIGGPEPVDEDGALTGDTVEPFPPPTAPEPGDDAEPVTDDARDAAERQALADIKAMLPSLTAEQQNYVKEKLGDGADPVKLLERVREVTQPK